MASQEAATEQLQDLMSWRRKAPRDCSDQMVASTRKEQQQFGLLGALQPKRFLVCTWLHG
eukprot:2230639-Amphidinium_carterae.1